ncbi:dnaj-like protein [Haloferax elongans ATCC BAA-1513]|uniref:Dnaj-like protein n=1 Tax=Haloferax elongans ATCC BAA-1513 TaxID=1230453 RepID=M0HPP6_HALEO|nr:J domain-containing protein [Haloferax elongans]ELZ86540.1 dnaj-like protein [Haloferax elongans ATCC BAA-1513]
MRLLPADEEETVVVADAGCEPHEVLSVAPDAPDYVVRGAYRELLQERHPDKGGSQAEFQELQEAKEGDAGVTDVNICVAGRRIVLTTCSDLTEASACSVGAGFVHREERRWFGR